MNRWNIPDWLELIRSAATIAETASGEFIGFLNKFKRQSFKTDALGHPL